MAFLLRSAPGGKILHPCKTLGATQTATALLVGLALLSGCGGEQSALAPHGPAARAINEVGWVMYIGATLILALVMGLALWAIFRRAERRGRPSETLLIVGGGLVFPVVTLSLLLFYGTWQMGALRAAPTEGALRIEVIGHRWWWEVHYLDPDGKRLLATANEIRIPAGVPVAIAVRTRDVIHSFWVPTLAGKIDLIPGHVNHIRLQADRPGRYRGQCAEFCGAMHALMAFHVIAETPEQFDAWFAQQQGKAAEPVSDTAVRGREIFLAHCVECHTVRGLGRPSEIGPDLTRLASRMSLAAGSLENTPSTLRRWITQSQQIKPGNAMPSFADLDAQDLDALLAYLEGLK